jgi:hypothetical protein
MDRKSKLIVFFFGLRNNLYLYHLTTYKYSRHVASGSLVDKLDNLIDKFLEIYFGKYGRPDQFEDVDLKLCKSSDAESYMGLSTYINFLNDEIPLLVKPNDTDLLNIRDEMVGILNNTKYLFELS